MEWVHRFRAAGAAADLDDLGVEGDGESLPVSVLPGERGGGQEASTTSCHRKLLSKFLAMCHRKLLIAKTSYRRAFTVDVAQFAQ